VLILGIDTSAHLGSVALLREERGVLETLAAVTLGGGQPSEALLPAIAAVLARHGLDRRSLSLVAVASGPGSFTGLRVSLATAKGLAEAFSIPIAAVSVLEALAIGWAGQAAANASSSSPRRVLAACDAQRGEVFFGEFVVSPDAGPAERLRETIAPFAAFAAECRSLPAEAASVTPDSSLAERLRAEGIAAALVARPTAEAVGRIGARKFLAGIRFDPAQLDANYLRRSEAELVSASKRGIPLRKD